MMRVVLGCVGLLMLGAGCGGSTASLVLPSGAEISVEVARGDRQRQQGLSGRDAVGQGMLFCMDDIGPHAFWMKDMRVPIDVVGLVDDRVVWVQGAVPILDSNGGWTRFHPEGLVMLERSVGSIEEDGFVMGAFVDGARRACMGE